MSKFELGLHLNLLLQAIPMPDAIKSRLESPPHSFDTSDAIARLLAGENPADIFQEKVHPFLNSKDLSETYLQQDSLWLNHNWKKKALTNTLRSAACLTIKSELSKDQVQYPLPSSEQHVGRHWPVIFGRRTVEVTSAVKNHVYNLHTPQCDTTFEKVLALLTGYLKIPVEVARKDILFLVGEESIGFTRELLPPYFHLVHIILERDFGQYKELSNQHAALDFYQQLCLNSQGIILRGASTSIGKMSAYSVEITNMDPFDPRHFFLRESCFDLHKNENKSGLPAEYKVRLKPVINKKIKETEKKRFSGHAFQVMITQCPAMARDRHTGEERLSMNIQTNSTEADLNLIQLVLQKVVLG